MITRTKFLLKIVLLITIIVFMGVLTGKGGMTVVTGGLVTDQVDCYNNLECNDQISSTEDSCRNPGTIYSSCVNKIKP